VNFDACCAACHLGKTAFLTLFLFTQGLQLPSFLRSFLHWTQICWYS
jgi:hypothetical protein